MANPSLGLLNIVDAGIENAVPKNRLKTPMANMNKLRKKVVINRNSILDLAFLIIRKEINIIKNKTEKLPKIAFISPVNVCLKGAM
jgi:hypothetical protein